MKSLDLLLSIILVASSSLVWADEKASTHTKKTGADGTTVTTDTSSSKSGEAAGTMKSTEDVKTVVNPKGLMNEASAQTHSERQVGPDGDYAKSNTVKHADGTEEKVTAEKSTSENWTNKGKTVTTTHARTVDPAGLGNKELVAVTEKVDTNPDGTEKKTLTKEVNGDTVFEETSVKQK